MGNPDPWRCYRECLKRTPAWATHRLIIQDDAVPGLGFASAAVAALTARPGRPVAFWHGGFPADGCKAIRDAARGCRRWVDLSPWSQAFPCVASAWPAAIAARLLEWSDASRASVSRADDAVTQRFLQAERLWPYATVPSLVEHPDVVVSVIGRKAWAGRDKARVACVPPDDRDLSELVW